MSVHRGLIISLAFLVLYGCDVLAKVEALEEDVELMKKHLERPAPGERVDPNSPSAKEDRSRTIKDMFGRGNTD